MTVAPASPGPTRLETESVHGWNDFGDGRWVTAGEFVRQAAVLLELAARATGDPEPAREEFIRGLGLILDTSGEFSALLLNTPTWRADSRQELEANAVRVNAFLLTEIRRAAESARTAELTPIPGFRSHCVGYRWLPETCRRIGGSRDNPRARDHYNEWTRQLVTLRDGLLVFTNPEEVSFRVTRTGLYDLQDARDRFAFEVVTRKVAQQRIVEWAAAFVLGRAHPAQSQAYGFGFAAGAVLPAILVQRSVDAPPHLLGYVSTHATAVGLPELPDDRPTYIVPEVDDYHAKAPREVELAAAGHAGAGRHVALGEAAIEARLDQASGSASLALSGGTPPGRWRVDVGSALRGHRYARRPGQGGTRDDGHWAPPLAVDLADLLDQGPAIRPRADAVLVESDGRWLGQMLVLGTVSPSDVLLFRGERPRPSGPEVPEFRQVVLLDLRGGGATAEPDGGR